MKSVAIKTFDAMGAPMWPGQRPKPQLAIRSDVLDAPPVPDQLRYNRTLIPLEPISDPYPTMDLTPTPQALKMQESNPQALKMQESNAPTQKTPALSFNASEEAWFSASEPILIDEAPGARMRVHAPLWLGFFTAFAIVSASWSAIAWMLIRTL